MAWGVSNPKGGNNIKGLKAGFLNALSKEAKKNGEVKKEI
jgi:hypothetical protein